MPQVVEPHPASGLGRHPGDRFPLGGELSRPLDALSVGPDSAVPERADVGDLAEQAGTDQRGQPDPSAEVRPAQRAPDPVTKTSVRESASPDSARIWRSTDTRQSGSGTVRTPARVFGYGRSRVPAVSLLGDLDHAEQGTIEVDRRPGQSGALPPSQTRASGSGDDRLVAGRHAWLVLGFVRRRTPFAVADREGLRDLRVVSRAAHFTVAELRQRREEIIGHLAPGADSWGGASGGRIFWRDRRCHVAPQYYGR
ncbi:hypothetical protein [Micromonospora sp. RTP1Z1]|uniref:hypothetical protein n=1 Tax=Micromonospora sp. RTP1Z1 TaxID=2994043 RepID=UPI0029C606BC|nr:hypothetical protein [Micromonospora sp. RTP1Z1]